MQNANAARAAAARLFSSARPPPPPPAKITLREEDLVETFAKGSGPGGQKINKCRHNVQLRHVPTGITVHCQEQRALHMNRKIARQILKDKLDMHFNGDQSKQARKWDKIRRQKSKSRQRMNKGKREEAREGEKEESADGGESGKE